MLDIWESISELQLERVAVEDGWLYRSNSGDQHRQLMTFVPASKETLSKRSILRAGPRRIRTGD